MSRLQGQPPDQFTGDEPALQRRLDRVWSRRRHVLALRGIVYPLVLSALVLFLGGVGFWMLDPAVLTLTDGMWLAFTTAATVGYGDLVPSTPAARLFAVLVVLVGLAVLSLVTAAVAAMFMERDERQIERDLLHEMARLHAQIDALRREMHALVPAPAPAQSPATSPSPSPPDQAGSNSPK